MLHKRCYISVAVLDGNIYALGGMNGEKRWLTEKVMLSGLFSG